MVELQIFIDILHLKSDELFSSNIVNGLYVYVLYDKGTCTNFFDYSFFELFCLASTIIHIRLLIVSNN